MNRTRGIADAAPANPVVSLITPKNTTLYRGPTAIGARANHHPPTFFAVFFRNFALSCGVQTFRRRACCGDTIQRNPLMADHPYNPAEQSALKALAFLNEGDPRNAREYFRYALKLDNNAAENEHLPDAAREALQRYLRADQLFDKGFSLYQSGQFNEAIKAFDQALQADPLSADAAYSKGVVHEKLGEDRLALKAFERALDIKPDYAKAAYNKGVAHATLGEVRLALKAFERALDIKPEFAEAANNKGVVHAKLGEDRLALKAYERALDIKPNYADAACNKGVAHATLGEVRLALKAYERALDIKPEYAEAANNKGVAHAKLGEDRLALKAYERALDIQPGFAGAWLNSGIVLHNHPDLLDPKKPDAGERLARWLGLVHTTGLAGDQAQRNGLKHLFASYGLALAVARVWDASPGLHRGALMDGTATMLANLQRVCEVPKLMLEALAQNKATGDAADDAALAAETWWVFGDPYLAAQWAEVDEANGEDASALADDPRRTYLLVRALYDAGQPGEAEWEVDEWAARHTAEQRQWSPQQSYYAGHLLRLSAVQFERYTLGQAAQLFEQSRSVAGGLPGLYMAWLCLHESGDAEAALAMRERLLAKELEQREATKRGFLLALDLPDLQMDHPAWRKDLLWVVAAKQIEPAVMALRGQEDLETAKGYAELIRHMSPPDRGGSGDIDESLYASYQTLLERWKLGASGARELERLQRETSQAQCQARRAALRPDLEALGPPLCDPAPAHDGLEDVLGKMIGTYTLQTQPVVEQHGRQRAANLIDVVVLMIIERRLTPQAGMKLLVYTHAREQYNRAAGSKLKTKLGKALVLGGLSCFALWMGLGPMVAGVAFFVGNSPLDAACDLAEAWVEDLRRKGLPFPDYPTFCDKLSQEFSRLIDDNQLWLALEDAMKRVNPAVDLSHIERTG